MKIAAFVDSYHYSGIYLLQPQTQPCAHEGVWQEADALGGKREDWQFSPWFSLWFGVCEEHVSLFHALLLPLALCKDGFLKDHGKFVLHYCDWVPKCHFLQQNFSWPISQFEPKRHLFPDFESDPEMCIYVECFKVSAKLCQPYSFFDYSL